MRHIQDIGGARLHVRVIHAVEIIRELLSRFFNRLFGAASSGLDFRNNRFIKIRILQHHALDVQNHRFLFAHLYPDFFIQAGKLFIRRLPGG